MRIRIRYKSLNSNRAAYGYFWCIDDVSAYAGESNRVRTYDQEYVEGGYGMIPQGMTIDPAWYTSVLNNGSLAQNNANAKLYHLPATMDVATEFDSYNNGSIAVDASKDVIEDLNNIKVIFTAVAGSLLSICVLVVLGLHIRDRHEEWCLYNSIGFSVGEIYIMALKELLISFALAIAFGALATGVLIGCLKVFLVDPMGLPLNPVRPGDMKMVGIMLITVFALCQIPVFWQMRTITTVDEIE